MQPLGINYFIMPALKRRSVILTSKRDAIISNTIHRICETLGEDTGAVLGRRQHRTLIVARYLCMCVLYYKWGVGCVEIGNCFHKSHSLVLRGILSAERYISVKDPMYMHAISLVEKEIGVDVISLVNLKNATNKKKASGCDN